MEYGFLDWIVILSKIDLKSTHLGRLDATLPLLFAKGAYFWHHLRMKRGFSTLSEYLECLQSRGKYWFLRKDVMSSLSLTDNAFKKTVHRLQAKGKLCRIRSDFYIIVTPENLAIGSLPATWFIDPLMQYLGQEYYVGLLTAASLHGAAHQQPMVFQVVTNKATRPIKVGRVRMEFLYKKSIKPYYFQQMKTVTSMMKVSTPEMTAFDLMKYINSAGQVNHVATILCELVEKLNPENLAKLLEDDDVTITSAQRLGYLLDFLELPINLIPLEMVLHRKKHAQRLLVTGVDLPVISHDKRWSILVNEYVEPDEL